MIEKPAVGGSKSLFEPYGCLPTQRLHATVVEELARATVGLAAIEGECAGKTDDLGDRSREVGDTDFLASPDIERDGVGIVLQDMN